MTIDVINRQENSEILRKLLLNFPKIPRFTFFNRTRYFIFVISVICLAWLMGNSILLNFTIICMNNDHSTYKNHSDDFDKQTG